LLRTKLQLDIQTTPVYVKEEMKEHAIELVNDDPSVRPSVVWAEVYKRQSSVNATYTGITKRQLNKLGSTDMIYKTGNVTRLLKTPKLLW
jgi:hypothetical protein